MRYRRTRSLRLVREAGGQKTDVFALGNGVGRNKGQLGTGAGDVAAPLINQREM